MAVNESATAAAAVVESVNESATAAAVTAMTAAVDELVNE